MSLSISFALIGTSFTSNSRLSSLASTQGSELCRVNGLNLSPSTGRPGHQADLRPLGGADARDGADQVVLEQPLALRR